MNLPFHKYVGPGNKLNNGPPSDSDDLTAREHDTAYEKARSQSDIKKADIHGIQDFIGNFQEGNLHSSIGALGLSAKVAAEKVFGPIYGMSHRHHPYYQNLLGVKPDPKNVPDSPNHDAEYSGDEGTLHQTQIEEPAQIHQAATGQGSKSERIRILRNDKIKSPNQIEEPPQKKIGIAQPNNSQQSLGNFFANFEPSPDMASGSAMDTMGAPGDVMRTGVGTKAGSGPGMGSAGAMAVDAPNILALGGRMPGIPFKHTLSQSYRFLIPACLTQHRIEVISTSGTVGTVAGKSLWSHTYRLGSSLCIDMESLFQYMDPSTFKHLVMQTSHTNVNGSSLEVWSNGVRAPYTTNTSNIEVANANLQAQIMDYSPLQEDYAIAYSDDNLHSKMLGNSYQITPATNYSADFGNVSARMETRALRQRAIIRDYFYAYGPEGTPTFGEFDVRPSDPNINQYIRKSVNGSNLLGKAFEHHYNISGELCSNHGTKRITPQGYNTSDGFFSLSDNNANNIIQYNNPIDNNDKPGGSFQANDQGFDYQQGTPNWDTAKLSGFLMHNKMLNEQKERYFISAIYNIRNIENDVTTDTGGTAYNSIVNLNWEVILKFNLNISGIHLNPLYYNVSTSTTGHRNKRKFMANAGLTTDSLTGSQMVYRKTTLNAYPSLSRAVPQQLTTGGAAAPTNAL